MRRAPCDAAIGHRLSGIGQQVQGSTFKVQGPNLQLSTFNFQLSTFNFQLSTFNFQPSTFIVHRSSFIVHRSCGSGFSPQERSDVGGRAGAAGRGARSDPTSDAWWAPSDSAPSVSDPCHQCRGDDPPAPPEVGVGATSPNVVAFGSSWRRKQEAAGTSRSPCAMRRASCDAGIGHRLSGIGHPVQGSTFKVQGPNLQLSTFNLRPSSFLVHRSSLIVPRPCARRRRPVSWWNLGAGPSL
jgi:hypothetical protein